MYCALLKMRVGELTKIHSALWFPLNSIPYSDKLTLQVSNVGQLSLYPWNRHSGFTSRVLHEGLDREKI